MKVTFARERCTLTLYFWHESEFIFQQYKIHFYVWKDKKFSHRKNISWNQLILDLLCKYVGFTKFLPKSVRINFRSNFHTEWQSLHCGNYVSLLSCYTFKCIFAENFVKVTFLLKKSVKSWFDDFFFFFLRENFWCFHSVLFVKLCFASILQSICKKLHRVRLFSSWILENRWRAKKLYCFLEIQAMFEKVHLFISSHFLLFHI